MVVRMAMCVFESMRMIVRMAMRVSVGMPVIVRMRMSVRMSVIVPAVSMIMPVMRVPESKKSNHVDQKPECTDDKQLLDSSQLSALENALSSLPNKFHTDQHEENAVTETSKGVEFAPPIGHFWAGGPFGRNRSAEANDETQAVEKHVNSVAQKTERSAEVAIQALDKHECEVQADSDVSCVLRQVAQDT